MEAGPAPTLPVQFSSVAQSCLTLCDPMDCSTPGFPVLPHVPELAQTHATESVMPSNHLILRHPLLLQFFEVARKSKFIETENRIEAARGLERGRENYCLMGREFCWGK